MQAPSGRESHQKWIRQPTSGRGQRKPAGARGRDDSCNVHLIQPVQDSCRWSKQPLKAVLSVGLVPDPPSPYFIDIYTHALRPNLSVARLSSRSFVYTKIRVSS